MRRGRPLLRLLGAVGALAHVACTSPDLSRTRFSCATNADCASGEACAPFDGVLACRDTPSASSGGCSGVTCSAQAGESATHAAARDAGALALEPCVGASCALPAPALGEDPSSAVLPLASPPGVNGEAPPASASAASNAGTTGVDAGQAAEQGTLRFDFESDLEGWQALPNARPSDALDRVEQSTALAHHGSGALRMVFDGQFTAPAPIPFDPGPFFGVYAASTPPPGAEVSLWMFSTASGVSVEAYAQTSPTLAPTVLATVPLLENAWREISVSMPLAAAQQFGIRVDSSVDVQGDVYLDEIRW